MAKPTLKSFSQALYDAMLPMQYDEPRQDYALAKFLAAVGEGFQVTDTYGRASGNTPGWANMLNPNLCPVEALGWLAQFVGVTLEVGLTEAQQRARIKAADGWSRGTVAAMRAAVAGHLTGTQSFAFRERYDYANAGVDSPYNMEVVTFASETPDPAAALAALLSQKPAGIVLHYVVNAGQDYLTVRTNNATYTALRTKYATYNVMKLAYG